jgi:hypothetical protein
MSSWYEQNRQRLSEKRKRLWRMDLAFRTRQQERDKTRRAQKRQTRINGWKVRTVSRLEAALKGSPFIDLDILAKVMGRSRNTLLAWLTLKVLPGVSAREGRRSLFSGSYARLIVEAFNEMLRSNLRGDSEVFRSALQRKLADAKMEVLPYGKGTQGKEVCVSPRPSE